MTAWRQPRGDGEFELRFGGGLNERDDFHVDPQECTEGYNFKLDAKTLSLSPRVAQDLRGTAPNAGEITGILQLITRDDTVTQVKVAGDIWYDWDGADIYSDVTPPLFTSGTGGSRMRGAYWSLDDILVITNIDLETPLYKWNGSTASRLKTTLTSGTTQSITSLTCSGSLATAITSTHGYSTGDLVTVVGANETEYNGEVQITRTDANTYTYPMSCSTTPATGTITGDKGPEIKAKFGLVHDHRVWLFNITADATETPHMILVSAYEDAEDYDNATRGTDQGGTATANDAFYILSPDGRPINSAVEFFNVIVFSTEEGKLFKITGDDAENYTVDEFYPGSAAQGAEAMASIGNDVVYFRRGKTIESLSSTDRFGDVSTDDLSLWVPETVKELCTPIVIYDEDQQKVYFFCNNLSGVLVLDKEYLLSNRELSPWSLYKTTMSNAFNTKCAVQIRDPLASDKGKTVMWGDDAGQVFNMNGTAGAGDAGSDAIELRRVTKIITELDTNNELMIGRLEYRRNTAVDVEMTFNWADEYHRETVVVPLKGSFALGDAVFWGGDYYWNETDNYWSAGRVVDQQISSLGFSVPGKGTGFFMELAILDVSDYTISKISI